MLPQDFEIVETASEEDAAFITSSLIAYNKETIPLILSLPLGPCNLAVKAPDGRIIGGLIGRLYLDAYYIEFLWVDAAYRKHGLGSLLLDRAESIARAKDCRLLHLDTFSFQAPEFYKKKGFTVFGVLDDYPDGICRYYLKKTLR